MWASPMRASANGVTIEGMEPLEPLPVIRPMLATPGPLPGVGEEAEWAFETKWDGARCVVAVAHDGSPRLSTRAGDDVTARYPELAELGRLLGGRLPYSTARSWPCPTAVPISAFCNGGWAWSTRAGRLNWP